MKARVFIISASVVVALLILVGCQGYIYSSDVSVDHCKNGVSDYTVVDSLDGYETYPESMPIGITESSTTEKNDHPLNNMLFVFTLGIIPGVESETTVYDVSVKTPLGIKDGKYSTTTSQWMGWLPLFFPNKRNNGSTVFARKRAAMKEAIDNLVSQFPKAEYQKYLAVYNAPEAREAREKKLAEEKRLAEEKAKAEAERIAKEKRIAEEKAKAEAERIAREQANIKIAFGAKEWEDRFNASVSNEWNKVFDMALNSKGEKWTIPSIKKPVTFLEESEEELMIGENLLADFGMKYLPNAYADYEKKREAALEAEQGFNEVFPKPWTVKKGDPQWDTMCKVLKMYVQKRGEYYWSRDAIAYYWYFLKLGVMNASDLAKVDSAKLTPRLLPHQPNAEVIKKAIKNSESWIGKRELVQITEDERAFAVKYAPEIYALFQELERTYKESVELLSECTKARKQMDNGRYSEALVWQENKRDDVAYWMNEIVNNVKTWRAEHRTTLKSSEEVARCDQKMAEGLKQWVMELPGYVKRVTLGPVILDGDMEKIPELKCQRQGHEVTLLQWMIVMGDFPRGRRTWYSGEQKGVSEEGYKGNYDPRGIVKFRGWYDRLDDQLDDKDGIIDFVIRLNLMSVRKYCLPTEEMKGDKRELAISKYNISIGDDYDFPCLYLARETPWSFMRLYIDEGCDSLEELRKIAQEGYSRQASIMNDLRRFSPRRDSFLSALDLCPMILSSGQYQDAKRRN